MNRDKARELLEKELRIRPTVKASAIFTVKRRGEVALIAPDDGLKCPYSSINAMLNNWHILLVIFER